MLHAIIVGFANVKLLRHQWQLSSRYNLSLSRSSEIFYIVSVIEYLAALLSFHRVIGGVCSVCRDCAEGVGGIG